MFGLVLIEVMTPSGHLSNINEIEFDAVGFFFVYYGVQTFRSTNQSLHDLDLISSIWP